MMSNMEMRVDIGMMQTAGANFNLSGQRMPLSRAEKNKVYTVVKISGKYDTKKHLSDLGFVEGEQLQVTSVLGGNIIVTVKGVKVALGEELAKRVTVSE